MLLIAADGPLPPSRRLAASPMHARKAGSFAATFLKGTVRAQPG
jgi:hypothetical protein